MHCGYGITFDSVRSWSFDNGTTRNVITFGVDNSPSSCADNRKNNFLMLSEGPTFGINGRCGSPEKKFSINFSNANTKFCLSLHYDAGNSNLFVNRKEISNGISNGFSATESEMCMIFQSITILLISNFIHKYLMTKNNIK